MESACGRPRSLVVLRRRADHVVATPANGARPLMVATCVALLLRQLRYSHDPLAFTTFFLIGEIGYVLVAHVALAYPSGRVTDRLERLWLKVAYAVALLFPLAVFSSTTAAGGCSTSIRRRARAFCSSRERRVDLGAPEGVHGHGLQRTGHALRRPDRPETGARNAEGAPDSRAAADRRCRRGSAGRARQHSRVHRATPDIVYDLFWWQIVGLTAYRSRCSPAFSVLASHACTSATSSSSSRRLQSTASGRAGGRARRPPRSSSASGCRSGRVRRRLGQLVHGAGRGSVTPSRVEHEGEPLAVLVHDPTLLDEPKLVEAVAAASPS